MRVLGAVGLVVIAASLVGCGVVEDEPQRRARLAVERVADERGGYPDEPVHCTRTPRAWLVERQTSVYLCAVQLGTGFCDLYLVRFDGPRDRVRLQTQRGDCTLPI